MREDYLRWLEPQLRDEHGNPSRSYWDLTNLMFDTPFTWTVDMDDNRLADGMDLRVEFGYEAHIQNVADRLQRYPGSFLEVLIGLSRRLAFAASGDPRGWAWTLLGNLELTRMWDPLTQPKQRRAQDIMKVAMERSYAPDGTGGFFPLAFSDDDQTRIQLWYQMHAYIAELHPEH